MSQFIEFSGEQLKSLLEEQTTLISNDLKNKIELFDPIDTFYKWHNIIHSIEEFINILMFGLEDDEQLELSSTPLDYSFLTNKNIIKNVESIISKNFDKDTSDRFIKLITMTIAINFAFKAHGLASFGNGLNLDTIGNAVTYYQSRRRYLITFLYVIPKLGKGTKSVKEIELINELLPLIEVNCIPLTSLNHQSLLLEIFNNYKVKTDGNQLIGSDEYQTLEKFFAEPERISIIDQITYRANQVEKMSLYKVNKKKIFSIAELKNSIILIEAAYSNYKMENSDFNIYKTIIHSLLEHSNNEYFISIDIIEFNNIISIHSTPIQKKIRKYLLNDSDDYNQNLNSFHPLIEVGSKYISNINLLLRFIYYFKNTFLNKEKKFQVHSGFVFEDMVKNDLQDLGFEVTDIKRINRKEFDVVTIKDNTIHNFQCKNNLIDLRLIELNKKSFLRYNRYLVNYYKKALVKESGREDLLIQKLGISDIKHYVISRFPVITDNNKIVSYNNLTTWIKSI